MNMKRKIFFALLVSIFGSVLIFSQENILTLTSSPRVITEETFKDYDLTNVKILVIPEGTIEIGAYAFGFKKFTEVRLPESLRRIGSYAFSYCEDLETVNIPKKVKEIADYAFEYCSNLKISFSEDASLERIGAGAFIGCKSLNIITIPESVIEIRTEAFRETGLKLVTLNDSLMLLDGWVFYDTPLQEVFISDEYTWTEKCRYNGFSLKSMFSATVNDIDNVKITFKEENSPSASAVEWSY